MWQIITEEQELDIAPEWLFACMSDIAMELALQLSDNSLQASQQHGKDIKISIFHFAVQNSLHTLNASVETISEKFNTEKMYRENLAITSEWKHIPETKLFQA